MLFASQNSQGYLAMANEYSEPVLGAVPGNISDKSHKFKASFVRFGKKGNLG